MAGSESAMEAVEAEAEGVPLAFVQKNQEKPIALFARTAKRHQVASPADGRDAVISLLRGKGAELRSTLLTSLASQLSADPFAKIKVLIQELIERLLKES